MNHKRSADSKLARFRPCESFPLFSPMVGNIPRESPGEFVGVAGGDCLAPAMTQGEPERDDEGRTSRLVGGVAGTSLIGFRGGDRSPLEPRPSPLPPRLSPVFSLSSRTTSADFLRTRPAASNAVVARCMMLTLPDRPLRPLDPLSLRLPLGVPGCDLPTDSVGVADGGDKSGPLGDVALGGVTVRFVLGAVGVAGINWSSGADCADDNAGGMAPRFRSSFVLRLRDLLLPALSVL